MSTSGHRSTHHLTTCSSDLLSQPVSISPRLFNSASKSISQVTRNNNSINNNNNNNNNNSSFSKSNRLTRIPVEGADQQEKLTSQFTMFHDHQRSKSTPSNGDTTDGTSNYYSTLQLNGHKIGNDINSKCKSTSTLPRQLNKSNFKSAKLSMSSPLLPLSAPFKVILKKKDGTLGFTICKKDDGMFYIKSVINEPAISEPAISPGDKILRVNGIDVSSLSHNSAISFLRSLPDTVTLLLEPVIPEDISLDMQQFNFYSTSRLNKLLDRQDFSTQRKGDKCYTNDKKCTQADSNDYFGESHGESVPRTAYSNDTCGRLYMKKDTSPFTYTNKMNNAIGYHDNNTADLDDLTSYDEVSHHLDSSGSSSSLSDIYYAEDNVYESKSHKTSANNSTSSLKKQLRPEALKMISEKGNTDSLSRLRLRKQKSKNRLQSESNCNTSSIDDESLSDKQSRSPDELDHSHVNNHSHLNKSTEEESDSTRNKCNGDEAVNKHNIMSDGILSSQDVILILPPEQFSDAHAVNCDSFHSHMTKKCALEVPISSSKLTGQSRDNFTRTLQEDARGIDSPTLTASPGNSLTHQSHPTMDNGRQRTPEQVNKLQITKCITLQKNATPSAKSSDTAAAAASSCVPSGESTVDEQVRVKLHQSTSVTTVKGSPICVEKTLLTTNGASLHSPYSVDVTTAPSSDETNNSSIDLLLPLTLSSSVVTVSSSDLHIQNSSTSVPVQGETPPSEVASCSSSHKFIETTGPVSTSTAPTIVPTTASSTSSSTSSSFAGDDAIPSLAKWRGANLVDHLYLAAIRDEQDSGFGDSVTPRHTLDKPLQLSRIINEGVSEEQSSSSSPPPHDNHRVNLNETQARLTVDSGDTNVTAHSVLATTSTVINNCTSSCSPVTKLTDCGSKVHSSSITKSDSMKLTSITSCSQAQPVSISTVRNEANATESNNNLMTPPLQWTHAKSGIEGDIVIPTITEATVEVCLEKGWSTRLGIQLEEDPLNRLPVYTTVKSIVPNTIASADGRIKEGWRLVSVNSKSLEGQSVKQVVDFLRMIKGRLNFRFLAPVNTS